MCFTCFRTVSILCSKENSLSQIATPSLLSRQELPAVCVGEAEQYAATRSNRSRATLQLTADEQTSFLSWGTGVCSVSLTVSFSWHRCYSCTSVTFTKEGACKKASILCSAEDQPLPLTLQHWNDWEPGHTLAAFKKCRNLAGELMLSS